MTHLYSSPIPMNRNENDTYYWYKLLDTFYGELAIPMYKHATS